jgi:hypothetical protein
MQMLRESELSWTRGSASSSERTARKGKMTDTPRTEVTSRFETRKDAPASTHPPADRKQTEKELGSQRALGLGLSLTPSVRGPHSKIHTFDT